MKQTFGVILFGGLASLLFFSLNGALFFGFHVGRDNQWSVQFAWVSCFFSLLAVVYFLISSIMKKSEKLHLLIGALVLIACLVFGGIYFSYPSGIPFFLIAIMLHACVVFGGIGFMLSQKAEKAVR